MKLGKCCRFCAELDLYYNKNYDETYICKHSYLETTDLDMQYCEYFEACESLKDVEFEEESND